MVEEAEDDAEEVTDDTEETEAEETLSNNDGDAAFEKILEKF